VKTKKSLFGGFSGFKKKKCDDCCDTCAPTCAPAPCAPTCAPTCECEDPCAKKKKSLFSGFSGFKRKKKCDDCCDTCGSCDSCGTTVAPIGPTVIPGKAPEVVPLPKGDKEKTQAPIAPNTNITPTSSPKPLELGSSPY